MPRNFWLIITLVRYVLLSKLICQHCNSTYCTLLNDDYWINPYHGNLTSEMPWQWLHQYPLTTLHVQFSLCHHLKQGSNQLSGRCFLLTSALPITGREKGGKGRETYKLNIKTSLLIILIILIIREIKQAAPGSPGLASAAGRNWTQECTDRNLDQDRGQNMSRVLLRRWPRTKMTRTSWSPSFKQSVMCMAWNTALVSIGSPELSAPSCKYDPFRLLTCRTQKICRWPWLL